MTYVKTEERLIRKQGLYGGMDFAGFRSTTLKHRGLFTKDSAKFLSNSILMSLFFELTEEIDVVFRSSDEIYRTWKWPNKFLKKVPDELLPFTPSQIRTIEAAACRSVDGQRTAVVSYKSTLHELWRVMAHLHDGQSVTLIQFFRGRSAANHAATQLNEAHRLVLKEMDGARAEARRHKSLQAPHNARADNSAARAPSLSEARDEARRKTERELEQRRRDAAGNPPRPPTR